MSEAPLTNAVSITAEDIADDRVRQLFGSGVLDGGTATLEAYMNDHDADPNVTAGQHVDVILSGRGLIKVQPEF